MLRRCKFPFNETCVTQSSDTRPIIRAAKITAAKRLRTKHDRGTVTTEHRGGSDGARGDAELAAARSPG